MTKLLPILLLASATALALVMPQGPQQVTLGWDPYPTNEVTGATIRVYYSADLDAPISSWTMLTNVPATDTSVVLTVSPGRRFFYCTAANSSGESVPSGTAPAREPNGLTIIK